MLKLVEAYDAKMKLPEFLREVTAGHSFTITICGKAIADLIPSKAISRKLAKTSVANLTKMKKIKISEAKLKEMKEEGRK